MFTDDKIHLIFQEMALDLYSVENITEEIVAEIVEKKANEIFALCDSKLKEGIIPNSTKGYVKANITRTWRLFEMGKQKALDNSDIPDLVKNIIKKIDYKEVCLENDKFNEVYRDLFNI